MTIHAITIDKSCTLETHLDTDSKRSLRPPYQQHRTRERARDAEIARSLSIATLHPLPGEHSVVEPPDPIPNSEVKRNCADGSVAQAMQE